MTFLIPPYWCGAYAILRYHYNRGIIVNLGGATLFIGFLIKIGLISSTRDQYRLYKGLYADYKTKVLQPKYRGIKLAHGKKAYQIDEKQFTTSNFDDLKELIMK